MADVSPDTLRAALRAIKDPASGRDIVTAGLVEGIEVRGGLVQATLLTDRAHAARHAAIEPVGLAAAVGTADGEVSLFRWAHQRVRQQPRGRLLELGRLRWRHHLGHPRGHGALGARRELLGRRPRLGEGVHVRR